MVPDDPKNHRECRARPYALSSSMQTNIVLTPTGLSYDQSRAPPPPRTAAPNRIKRTTHTPFFSTTSREKCSFFRLPAEIRCLIYHELLICGEVQYHICVATSRLLLYWYQAQKPNYPYVRHGLYPSILECCRLAHEEGAPLLYGENKFSLAACAPNKRIVNTWPLSKRNMELITSLGVGYWRLGFTRPLVEISALFSNLSHITIFMGSDIAEWESFLETPTGLLGQLQSAYLAFIVESSAARDIRLRYSQWDSTEQRWIFDMERTEAACFGLYKPVLEQYLPSTKRTRWKLRMSFDLQDDQPISSFKVEVSWGRYYKE